MTNLVVPQMKDAPGTLLGGSSLPITATIHRAALARRVSVKDSKGDAAVGRSVTQQAGDALALGVRRPERDPVGRTRLRLHTPSITQCVHKPPPLSR